MPLHHIELTSRAAKDLSRLDKPARARIVSVLRDDLTANPVPDNLDVKALKGASPWLRLRVGDHRVVYRPLTDDELRPFVASYPRTKRPVRGFLVERIVNRRDLDRAVSGL